MKLRFAFRAWLLLGILACEASSAHRHELLARKWKIVNIESDLIRKNLAEASAEEKKAYQQNLIDLSKNLVIEFEINGNYTRVQKNLEDPSSPLLTKGKWKLSPDQKNIEIEYETQLKEVIPILKLTSEELVIEITEDKQKSTFTLKPL